MDALTQKVREGGRIINVAVVIAVGVNRDGHREILGLDVITTEDGAGWLAFLRGLVARGLAGTSLVISDAHPGLVDAIAATLVGVCVAALPHALHAQPADPGAEVGQPMVATIVRTIFAQPDAASVWAQHARVVEQLHERFPDAAALLDEAATDVLAFTGFPKEHWRQIWSNNPQERLNKELRRRTDVVGIFPNRDAVIRLVGAVLAEQTRRVGGRPPLHERRRPRQGPPPHHHQRPRGGNRHALTKSCRTPNEATRRAGRRAGPPRLGLRSGPAGR